MRQILVFCGIMLIVGGTYLAEEHPDSTALPAESNAVAKSGIGSIPARSGLRTDSPLRANSGPARGAMDSRPMPLNGNGPRPLAGSFAAADSENLVSRLTPEAEYVDPLGRVLQGREAIATALADFYATNPEGRIEIQMDSIRFIKSGLAIEDGFTTRTAAAGEPAVRTRYTALEVRHGGNWYIASVRESQDYASEQNGREPGHFSMARSPRPSER